MDKQKFYDWISELWKNHIVDDFPYSACCFDCNHGDCEKCEFKGDEKV